MSVIPKRRGIKSSYATWKAVNIHEWMNQSINYKNANHERVFF